MQVSRFTDLLEKPLEIIQESDLSALRQIVETYPYFQAARGMELIGLKNANSFKYNAALKKHAAYTSDRSWLFEIITQEAFNSQTKVKKAPQTSLSKETDLAKQGAEPSEIPTITQKYTEEDYTEQTSDKKNDSQQVKEANFSSLELGKPLEFNKNDRYSFEEWLQLSAKNSVENKTETSIVKTSDTPKKAAKMAQINAFIATNPKMSTPLTNPEEITIKDAQKINKEALMTETLARVYLEQKKYKKALQAYKILSLKYPEKSGFFADQIKAIKDLQENNTEK